jgi:competence protein ComEA
MRARRSAQEQVAEVARRRLQQLSAELAELRPEGDGPARDPSAAEPVDDPALPPTAPGRHAQRSVGLGISTAGWMHDRMPPALQGRVQLRPRHLAVLAVLVVAAFGVTGWWVSRSQGSDAPLPAVTAPPTTLAEAAGSPVPPTVAVSTPVAGDPSAGAGDTGLIVVDVAGKVRRPGIATLPTGSRVVDALHAAGGPRRGVGLGSLNLARVLTDGEQILVGVPAPPGLAASAASAPTSGVPGSTPMVNINTASQSELEQLPDVGPVTALAIVEFRTENGAFTSVDELLEVSGIGDATLAKVAPFVTL